MAKPLKNLVLVGAISGAFGVRGEARLRSFTADGCAIFDYAPFFNEKGELIFEISSWREIKDGFAFFSPQIKTREDAMAKRNVKLYVPREKLPQPEEDEFYHVDLIGMKIESLSGEYLGEVSNIIVGAQDLLEISKTPNVKKSWFLPFTKSIVPIVDFNNQKLICDIPDGLIEIDDN